MRLKFDVPPDTARYGFYVNGGKLRVYEDLGSAKNAWHAATRWRGLHVDSFILEKVDGQWFVLYRIPAGTEMEKLPWYKDTYSYHLGEHRVARPMTRDEYAEWRLKVEAERQEEFLMREKKYARDRDRVWDSSLTSEY